MRAPSLLVLALILWPIGEIAGFAWVGGHIGVLNTIGLVLLAGFLGLALLRYEGFGLAGRIQRELSAGHMPAGEMLEGMVVVIAALLLILPGFISDILAFLLLFAPARKLLISLIASRVTVHTMGGRDRREADGRTIDLDADDYSRREDGQEDRPPEDRTRLPGRGSSPWDGRRP